MLNKAFSVQRITVVASLLFSVACTSNLERYGTVFANLMKNDNGQFRGISIGDNRNYVKKMEAEPPVEVGENELLYQISVSDIGTCDVRYGFENNMLYEIKCDLSIEDLKQGLNLLSSFTEYYNSKFGNYQKEGGFLVWQTKGKTQGSQVTIEMSDESSFAEMSTFSLFIYDYRIATGQSNP